MSTAKQNSAAAVTTAAAAAASININGNPVAAAYAKQEQLEAALEQKIDTLFPRCPQVSRVSF